MVRTQANREAERFTLTLIDDDTHWVLDQGRYNCPDEWWPITHTLEQGLSTQGFNDKLLSYRLGTVWRIPKARLELRRLLEALKLIKDRLEEHGGCIVLHPKVERQRRELVALHPKPAPKLPAVKPAPEAKKQSKRGKPDMYKTRWSAVDDQRLIKFLKRGFTDPEIALLIRRTEHAIRSRRQKLKMDVSMRGERSPSTAARMILELTLEVEAIKERLEEAGI